MRGHFSKSIEASELLLNKKGKVYHLNLAPDDIADTIITVGDPERVKKISQYFDRIEHKASHREFITHTGYIGKKRLSVVSTGIGTDNIDIVLNELDALVNIDLNTRTIKDQIKSLNIIRLGTCGSLQQDIAVDTFVTTNYAIGLDNLMHYYHHNYNTDEQFILNEFVQQHQLTGKNIIPYIAEASIKLLPHFAKGFQHGITVTCPGFFGPQGRVLRGQLSHPYLQDGLMKFNSRGHRIFNYEMETAGIYGLGKLLGHQCVSISNVIVNRADKTVSADAEATTQVMIQQALGIIEKI